MTPTQQRDSEPPPGSASRALFLDLDSLLAAAKNHILAQPTVYPQELARASGDGVMLRPERLTVLLDGQQQQQPALVLCRSGTYFNGSLENAQTLKAAGWDLKKKGTLEHRTLENLMEKNLEQVGACSPGATPKAMILATGELRPPTQSCIQAYLQSGWCVKLYCLQRWWKQAIDDLSRAYQERFTVVYLDHQLSELLAKPRSSSSQLSQMATNRELWNRVCDHRGKMQPIPHSRAMALAAAQPRLPSSYSHRSSLQIDRAQYGAESRYEQDSVERRRNWLAMLPKVYTPGNRQRYIFLNLDNIAGSLFTSHTLYQRVDGATSPRDVRLNFKGLTQCLRGDDSFCSVKCQLAAYWKTSPYLARALEDFGWTLRSPEVTGGNDKALHCEMMLKLLEGASSADEKTLVLATGDGGLGSANTNAYRDILGSFLEQRWHVEIYAWLHALNNGFLELQTRYPGDVTVKPLDDYIGGLAYPKNRECAALVKPTNVLQDQASFVTSAALGEASFESSSQIHQSPGMTGASPKPMTWVELLANCRRPPSPAPAPPQPSISALQEQIQQMLEAFAKLQSSVSTQQRQNVELEKSMREQASIFEEERQRLVALAEQQAQDARLARRLQLEEREESLTCPITCDLYEEPVTTVCCGKTFSAVVVKQLEECPWCRTQAFSTHPNRDVASLVELYRAERDELDGAEEGERE